jgi:hypothetical protein
MDRLDYRIRRGRQEAVDEMRARDWLRLGAPIALELSPEPAEGEQRSVVVQREPHDVLLFRFRVWLRRVFREAVCRDQATDSGGVEILMQACTALDRAEEMAETINNDGPITIVKGVPREHPLLRAELSNRAFTVRCLQKLGLNFEVVKAVGRPPGLGGKILGVSRRHCAACDRWWDQHEILCDELKLAPWQWPAVENPDAVSPYPEWHANKNLAPDLEAQERYRVLEATL